MYKLSTNARKLNGTNLNLNMIQRWKIYGCEDFGLKLLIIFIVRGCSNQSYRDPNIESIDSENLILLINIKYDFNFTFIRINKNWNKVLGLISFTMILIISSLFFCISRFFFSFVNKNKQILQIPTAVDRRNLYFNVIVNREGNQTVTVEGAGVNATLIQADIAQMNGYVHIIDRVLGVPFATVYDKLRTDPMLK